MLTKNKIPAISLDDAKQYGCPLCGLSFFPEADNNIGVKGFFEEICHDDDQSNMDASGGCGHRYYVFLKNKASLPEDAFILPEHPRKGNPAHDDGQRYKNDLLFIQIEKDLSNLLK